MTPGDLGHMFFTDSGSKAIDTALKIALGYRHNRYSIGRNCPLGRLMYYHIVIFDGITVGGDAWDRRAFCDLLDVHHMPHTLPAQNRFSRGIPETDAERADALEEMIAAIIATHLAFRGPESQTDGAEIRRRHPQSRTRGHLADRTR